MGRPSNSHSNCAIGHYTPGADQQVPHPYLPGPGPQTGLTCISHTPHIAADGAHAEAKTKSTLECAAAYAAQQYYKPTACACQRQALLLTHTYAYRRACIYTYVHGDGRCTRPLDRMIQSRIQNLTTVQSNILACSAEVLHCGNVAFSSCCEHFSCKRHRPMVILLALWPLLLPFLPTAATAACACWLVQRED